MRGRKFALLGLVLALCMLLSGCFVKTLDELYALPRHSDEYDDLQLAIDGVMGEAGCDYCAPVSGSNQQSVQLADLDGDGEDEAVVFAKTAGEKPLKAYLFDRQDGKYQNVAVIEGNGAEFSSVQYEDLDGEAGVELILGRRLSDQVLQSVSVYALRAGEVQEMMSASYSSFTLTDLDNDGKKDLFLLRFELDKTPAAAELYRCREGKMERGASADLSDAALAAKRVTTGLVAYNMPAVFVTSTDENDALLTDVFVFRGGRLQNLSAGQEKSAASAAVRNAFAYAEDLNADGIVELPELALLPAAEGAEESYCLIRWYQLGLDGSRTVVLRTYHRFSSGWYVEIPESWDEKITISRKDEENGARALVFSAWNGAEPAEPIFTIYAFSGEDRLEKAQQDGRFLLLEQAGTAYSALLGTAPQAGELTQQAVLEMFHIIHVDWNSGET